MAVGSAEFNCNVCGRMVTFQNIDAPQLELMLSTLEALHKHSSQQLWEFYKAERENLSAYRESEDRDDDEA